MSSRFPSKLWSCGDLTRGAAAVVDRAAMDSELSKSAVVGCKRGLLSETRGMSLQQLEKMLQDPILKFSSAYIENHVQQPMVVAAHVLFQHRHFKFFLGNHTRTSCKLHSCCPLPQKTNKIILKTKKRS